MRTDPRAMCANARENRGWAILHDLVAHPLMAATLYSPWSVRFHDWTSFKAWPVRSKALNDLPVYPDAGLGPQVRSYDETYSIADMLRAEEARNAA